MSILARYQAKIINYGQVVISGDKWQKRSHLSGYPDKWDLINRLSISKPIFYSFTWLNH